MIGILLNSYLLKLIQIICISVRPILNSKKQKLPTISKPNQTIHQTLITLPLPALPIDINPQKSNQNL